jgi:hypothetical protein
MAKPDLAKFDGWLRAASLLCTAILIPAVGWAWNMNDKIGLLGNDISSLRQQVEGERRGNSAVIDELKMLRASMDALKSDLQQRLTRVETRLDSK